MIMKIVKKNIGNWLIKQGLRLSKKDPIDLYREYYKEIEERRKEEIETNFKGFEKSRIFYTKHISDDIITSVNTVEYKNS